MMGNAGSTAQAYAEKYGRTFVTLDEPTESTESKEPTQPTDTTASGSEDGRKCYCLDYCGRRGCFGRDYHSSLRVSKKEEIMKSGAVAQEAITDL